MEDGLRRQRESREAEERGAKLEEDRGREGTRTEREREGEGQVVMGGKENVGVGGK